MDLLILILQFAAPLAVLLYLLWESNKPARPRFNGSLVLSHGKLIWTLGILFGIVIPLGLAVIGLFAEARDPRDPYYFLALVALFGGIGVLLLLETSRHRVVISSFGIEHPTIWGNTKQFAWNQVTSVDYSSQSGNFVLHSHSGEKIRVNTYLQGIPSFFQYMSDHLPPPMYSEALRKAGRKLPIKDEEDWARVFGFLDCWRTRSK